MSTLTKMKIPYCFIKVQTLYVFIIKKQTKKKSDNTANQQSMQKKEKRIHLEKASVNILSIFLHDFSYIHSYQNGITCISYAVL